MKRVEALRWRTARVTAWINDLRRQKSDIEIVAVDIEQQPLAALEPGMCRWPGHVIERAAFELDGSVSRRWMLITSARLRRTLQLHLHVEHARRRWQQPGQAQPN